MASFILFALGLIDLVGGIILTSSNITILPQISKFVSLLLIGKGIWTIITSFA